jgi:hypothetical protein
LQLATLLCGDRARRDVFEPLVADWQRELAACAGVARGRAMPRTALLKGLTAL